MKKNNNIKSLVILLSVIAGVFISLAAGASLTAHKLLSKQFFEDDFFDEDFE